MEVLKSKDQLSALLKVCSSETFNTHLPFFESLIDISLFVKVKNDASTALTRKQNSIDNSTLSLTEQTERVLEKIRNGREAKANNVIFFGTFHEY